MSKVVDTFFGGAEKKAGQVQAQAAREGQQFVRQGVNEARADIARLFPLAGQQQQAGFQGALDVFRSSMPAQQQAFQGGNVAAQQALIQGLPQIQNAILGNPVNLGGIQAYQAPLQNNFIPQQLPDFSQFQGAQQPVYTTAAQTGRGEYPLLAGRF